jgi:hypothetical protein
MPGTCNDLDLDLCVSGILGEVWITHQGLGQV